MASIRGFTVVYREPHVKKTDKANVYHSSVREDEKKGMISPTPRTLEYIRSQGWEADIVERFNPYAGKFGQRKDLFGIIDIIALTEDGITGIQSCGQSFSEHNKKLLENPLSLKWIEKGGNLLLIGWRKVKLKRGGKALRWQPRIKKYTKDDFI